MIRTPQRTTRVYDFPAYRPPGRQAVAAWDHAGIFISSRPRSYGAGREEIDMSHMEEIIKRLRKEKAESEATTAEAEKEKADKKKTDLEKGRERGRRWASEAHYEDLKKMAGYAPTGIGGFYREIVKDYAPTEERGISDMASWAKGWLEGVKAFWEEVESQL